MTPGDMENLRKFSICTDQHADGMTIVPQVLLAKIHAEIERQRAALEVSEAVNRAKTELLMDVVALLSDDGCTPGQRVMNARTAIAVRTGPPRTKGPSVDVRNADQQEARPAGTPCQRTPCQYPNCQCA